MKKSSCIWTLLTTLFLALLATFSFAAGPGYHVIKTYKLGGDGGWDYLTLDSATRRLYISRSTHVIVIDADSGKSAGDIPDTPGVHGIALASDLGKGFVSNGREGTASIFDLATLKLITKVKVGENPDAILYDPASKRTFTFNGRSHDASVIDADKGTLLGTIKLAGKPEFGVSDQKGTVFVNIEDKSELQVLHAFLLRNLARGSKIVVVKMQLLLPFRLVFQGASGAFFHRSQYPFGLDRTIWRHGKNQSE